MFRAFARLQNIPLRSFARMSHEVKDAFVLPPLPWAKDALAPHISAETIDFHYGKHHATYVKTLNDIAKTTPDIAKKSLDELVKTLPAGKPFNMAAQVWNHTFYWNSMSPRGGGKPSGELAEAIDASFGSFDKFKELFTTEAVGHFASGWAWLIMTPDNKLKVISTHDAENPLSQYDHRGIPLLTADVWEHAYYIDYRNARANYVNAWWNVVNWQFAAENYSKAK